MSPHDSKSPPPLKKLGCLLYCVRKTHKIKVKKEAREGDLESPSKAFTEKGLVVNTCNPNTQKTEGRRVVSLNAARVQSCQKYKHMMHPSITL